MIDTLQEIWGALKRNKMRTCATGIAVASGIFLLIVLLGAGNGIIHTLRQNNEGLALDAINIWPGQTSKPFNGLKEGRNIQLFNDDRDLLLRNHREHIRATSAQIQRSETASVGKNHLSVSILGVFPAYTEVEHLELLRGRFINQIDMLQRRRVVIIDEKAEESLYGEGTDAIGQSVRIGNSIYLVVGILKNDYTFGSNTIYAPFSTIRTIYSDGKTVDQITLRAKGGETAEELNELSNQIRQSLGARHEFAPDDRSAVWIWNMAEDNASMNQAENILSTSFWILGLLTLLSGVVGVSNIMLIAVKERTHEFGIRKALGAHPWNIIRMVILESILITSTFGYIGMVCGIGFCEWMDASVGSMTLDIGVAQQKVFIDPTVDLHTCIQATGVLIIAGALAGFFPARKAAKVKPIEALRG